MVSRLPSAPPALSGYSYLRPLGSGGFADVFLFQQNMPKRQVAVKVLLQDFVDQSVLNMFNAEADIMAGLSAHPSILTVYDASISSDGRPYLVMEFCPSGYGRAYRKQALAVAEVLHLGVKLASALETAHRAGVLHRDIKPSNILMTSFGAPVLADFGIASSLGEVSANQPIAMSIPWSAPEVVSGKTAGSVQSEVWALGATLYSFLAGHSPFEDREKNSRDQLKARIVRANYTKLTRPDVPEFLNRTLAKAMNRDPALRYQSMLEFALDLQNAQSAIGMQPTPLEVSLGETSTGIDPIDMQPDSGRGPVKTTVPVNSSRVRRTRKPVTILGSDEELEQQLAKAPTKKVSKTLIVAAVLVAAGFAIGIATLFALGIM